MEQGQLMSLLHELWLLEAVIPKVSSDDGPVTKPSRHWCPAAVESLFPGVSKPWGTCSATGLEGDPRLQTWQHWLMARTGEK